MKILIENLKKNFINYNYYYTDNFHKTGKNKLRTRLNIINFILFKYRSNINCNRGAYYDKFDLKLIIGILSKITRKFNINMEKFNCEKVLGYLHAIYKIFFSSIFICNNFKKYTNYKKLLLNFAT